MEQARSTAITVVISTLDRPAQLARCLGAIRAGTVLPERVVVVDQGDPEPVADVVAKCRATGLAVTHLTQARLGLSASQNAGVAEAGTSVVAVVDDDCVPAEDWIAVVQDAFDGTHPRLLLTGRVLPLPAEGDRVVALSVRDGAQVREWTRAPMPWHIGTGGNFAVDREAFLAAHGNDERLGTGAPGRGGNDLDLFHRLIRGGATARFEPRLLVRHERATLADYRSRRSTYGYGVGAMLGIWARRRDPDTTRVLLGWLRLRVGIAWRKRSQGGVAHEARVLGGTVAGLVFGLRLPASRPGHD